MYPSLAGQAAFSIFILVGEKGSETIYSQVFLALTLHTE